MAFGAKIKLTVDTSNQKTFRNEIQKFVNASVSSNPIEIKNIKLKVSKAEQTRLMSQLAKDIKSSDSQIELKIKKINANAAIKDLRRQLETMLSGLSITGLKEFLGTEGVESTYAKAAQQAERFADAAKNANQKTAETNALLQQLGSVQKVLGTAFTSISNLSANSPASELITIYEELMAKLQRLKSIEEERTTESVGDLSREAIALKQEIQLIAEKEKQVKRTAAEEERAAKRAAKANMDVLASYQKVATLQQGVTRYLNSNTRLNGSGLDNELKSILAEINSGIPIAESRLKELSNEFAYVKIRAQQMGLTGASALDLLRKAYEKFGGWSFVTKTLSAAIRSVKRMIENVRVLDGAMTELRKVTNETDSAYDGFFNSTAQRAKNIGATVSDTINATADFARLGFDLNESAKLAEAALVYKNVGDGIDDVSESTESLISTIKAFNIEASNAMSIVDKYNEVGNNFAISSEGLGVALQKSASSLAAANTTLEESIALATAMNSVVQNPEIVGTALKTISMYMRAAKTEVEEAGESTEGMANSVSELREQILTLTNRKVDIMIDDNTFKGFYQQMQEIAAVWDELADVDRANLIELMGGKRNATVITSLMTNFQDAERALETASNASGSALAENEKYLDSINGKLAQFSAAFEALSGATIDSDLFKGVIDTGTKLLEIITSILDNLGAFPTAIAAIAAGLSAFKNVGELIRQFYRLIILRQREYAHEAFN